MRLSFVSALAAISALQVSGEQFGAAAGRRSSLDTPSLFAVRKNAAAASSHAAVFGIPRGGATAAAPAKASTGAALQVNDIFSKEKRGWTIGLCVNLLYLYFFFNRPGGAQTCDFAAGGFCVTNYDKVTNTCPLSNSHTWSFVADAFFTYLGIKAPTNRPPLMRWGLVATILSHGILHAALGVNGCGGSEFPGALALFGTFGALISYFIIESTANFSILPKLVLTALCTYFTVALAGPGGSDGISSIFLISQLVATGVVTVTAPGALKDMAKIGNAFVLPCLISLVELLFCCGDGPNGQGLFNKFGGHVWYDIFLHRCIVMAISDGATSDDKKK